MNPRYTNYTDYRSRLTLDAIASLVKVGYDLELLLVKYGYIRPK
jgi:hypothetical protein